VDRFYFRFVTVYAFERQTDRILIARPRLHSMQRGNKSTNESLASCSHYCSATHKIDRLGSSKQCWLQIKRWFRV